MQENRTDANEAERNPPPKPCTGWSTASRALGGGGPAAMRAAIMGALLVLAPALGRRYNVFTALALATLAMTAIEPLVIFDAGFQLTVLATLGLPLFTPTIQRWLLARLGGLGHVAGVRVAAELVAVTLAAQLATLPVLALTFHFVSLVAPLANLLAVPLLAPLMLLGGGLSLVGLLPGALGVITPLALGWVVWPLLWLVNGAIALCAALPAAALAVPDLPGLVAWLYYALLAGFWWGARPWLRRRRARRTARASVSGVSPIPARVSSSGGHLRLGRGALAGLVALSLLGALGAAAPVALAGGTARLDFLDVGAGGEAALLRLPSGVTVLVNGGWSGPALEAALAEKLPFWRRSLDLALLTDPRPGDVVGLRDAADHFRIARGADAGMAHPSADYLAWLDALARTGATHTRIRQGNVITLDATSTLQVLSPPQALFPPGQGDTNEANDLILRLETPGLRALFLGGVDAYALDALAGSGEPLAADVVEVALAPEQTLDLPGPLGDVLRLAHPRLIVVAEAPTPPGSLAARRASLVSSWITDGDAAKALGALVYRVSEAGTISLSGGADGWSLGG
jgi:ComEC/Rec2-related protein